MPCAMVRGKPNTRAPTREVWIGLWSPETAAYSRPTRVGTRHTPPAAGGGC
jgi:hypothetical protein